MKMTDDPRWKSEEYMALAIDSRLRPMFEHYRLVAMAERATCSPDDRPAYDALVANFAVVLDQGGEA